MAGTAAQTPEIAMLFKRPFDEQAAFFRGKLGNLLPSETWLDVMRDQHDRGFMVAGAQSADLLSDLAVAVDRSISEGKSIQAFRKDFEAIVEKYGWDYKGPRNWRTRTIYSTNMASSYAGGRVAQLRASGFKWWLYRHSDLSLVPRPLHVSWDGMALPADDPWWGAHYPPNGWGCRCRVIGLRKPEDAERYGGEAVTKAPDNGFDPKTGMPAGIDEGWDYMPGNTVSGGVHAMAQKTTQWEYTLAKAYMQGVPESARDALAVAYRGLPSVADDTRRYARRVLENLKDFDVPPYRTMGLLTRADAATVKEITGEAVDGFDFVLDSYTVRHVLNEHGDDAAGAITADDYARLPRLLNTPERIQGAGKSWRTGHPLVRYEMTDGKNSFVAVFEVRRNRRMMALDTFYIRGKRP